MDLSNGNKKLNLWKYLKTTLVSICSTQRSLFLVKTKMIFLCLVLPAGFASGGPNTGGKVTVSLKCTIYLSCFKTEDLCSSQHGADRIPLPPSVHPLDLLNFKLIFINFKELPLKAKFLDRL